MLPGDDRLTHGYTKTTRRVAEVGIVEKVYDGRDATVRLRREAACLLRAASVLPVPAVVDIDEPHRTLRTRWIEGAHGQRLMQPGSARSVLMAAGSLLRQFQRVGATVLESVLDGDGTVAVHGDFGPQNLLFDAHVEVVALLDWEFAHMGEAVEDLAWAEWIVRMHHPAAIDALDELFVAYGNRPSWPTRHEAMVLLCERIGHRCRTEGLVAAEQMWRRRLDTTERWEE